MKSPFSWNDYLTLAEELVADAKADDARLRTAISRAYYCAYHIATEKISNKSLLPPPGGGRHRRQHKQLWKDLQEPTLNGGRSDLTDIGERGQDLMEMRHDADYRQSFNRYAKNSTFQAIAQDSIKLSKDLLSLIQAI